MSNTTKPPPDTLPPLDLSGGSKYVPPEAGIGERIRAKRKELDLTVEQLSALTARFDFDQKDADTGGVSPASIYRYEKEGEGKSFPGARELRLLCEGLNTSPNWLLLGQEWNQELEADAQLADALRSLLEMATTRRALPSMNEGRNTTWAMHLQAVRDSKPKPRK